MSEPSGPGSIGDDWDALESYENASFDEKALAFRRRSLDLVRSPAPAVLTCTCSAHKHMQ